MKQANGWAGRLGLSALLAMFLALPPAAIAQDAMGIEDTGDDAELAAQDELEGFQVVPTWYLGGMLGYVRSDSSRDGDGGINYHGVIGLVLADSLALELNGFHQEIERDEIDKRYDRSSGVGLDLTLGTTAPGNPFFMVGGGVIHEDLETTPSRDGTGVHEENAAYANVGLGLYLPFSFWGELWRLEGRYNIVFNDETTREEDFFEDARFNFGVVFPLGRPQATEPEPVAQAAPPPPPPPPPAADADQDGVPDDVDRCPGTPAWVRPDAAGCTPDSDGDGVDETMDCCPATPAGTPVDEKGCVPPPPPAPEPVDTDADGDGVPDRLDQCPHTVAGYAVDEKGCVRVESVVLENVHFELDSDALTPQAYLILNSVAASLKATPEGVTFEIAGHADATGGPAYNMTLSRRRAAVVRDFLIYTGVPSERLVAAGYGETKPIADNDTDEGRARNRRVEFRSLGN